MSTRGFDYERVSGKRSVRVRLVEQVDCNCRSDAPRPTQQLQLGDRRKGSKVSGSELQGISDKRGTFFSRLFASYARVLKTAKETNVTVSDLFVGNQMLFHVTASPVQRARTSTSGKILDLGMVTPVSKSAPRGNIYSDVGNQSSRSLGSGRRSHSDASNSRGRKSTSSQR